MGRDWTPWEQYAAEQSNIAMGRGDYWSFLEKTVMRYANGESVRICSDEELALRKQFPVLGKLMCENGDYGFTSLYEKLSKVDGGLDLLSRKDKELAAFIASGQGDKDGYLIKWFLGELDPDFYYSEHNHHLFGESLVKEALLYEKKDSMTQDEHGKSLDDVIKNAKQACKEENKNDSKEEIKFEEELPDYLL